MRILDGFLRSKMIPQGIPKEHRIKQKLKPEARLKKEWATYIFKNLPDFIFEWVENKVANGTPDCTYTNSQGGHGWIEFKYLNKPPADASSPIKLRHWSGLQRKWIERRYLADNLYMILRIGDVDFILDSADMFQLEDRTYDEMLRAVPYIRMSDILNNGENAINYEWVKRLNYNSGCYTKEDD